MARIISLKYAGSCTVCGKRLARGVLAAWTGKGQIECQPCYDEGKPSAEDYECSDMGYEDACARAVGETISGYR